MKVLSVQEAQPLLEGHVPESFVGLIQERLPISAGPYAIPPDSGRKVAMARDISRLLLVDSELFLLFRNWKVWQSCEHFDLFDGYRQFLGESRPIWEAPAHLFSRTDEAKFISILAMGLFFVWDVLIFDARGSILVKFSHDEWMEFRIQGTSLAQRITEWVARFELDPLGSGKS